MDATLPPDETEPSQVGERVGSYRVTRRISHGGMAVLYEGQDENGIKVAIKVLRACHLQNADIAARFSDEARVANLVRRGVKGLVDFYAVLTLPNLSQCIVMEYLEGEPMSACLERQGGHPTAHDIRLFRQLASSLKALHEAGIVHRDVTPKNVIIVADDELPGGQRCKLIDFGIAKVPTRTNPEVGTRIGTFLGNDVYAPPEQRTAAHTVDGKADVYSLGVMLFQLCSGRLPFNGPDFSTAHLYEEPPSLAEHAPHLPKELRDLVHRMLQKKSADRPDIAEIVQKLEKCAVSLEYAKNNNEKPDPINWKQSLQVALGCGTIVSILILLFTIQASSRESGVVLNPSVADLHASLADIALSRYSEIVDMAQDDTSKIEQRHLKLTTFPPAFATIRTPDHSILCKITPSKPCEVELPAYFEEMVLTAESERFKKKTVAVNVRRQPFVIIKLEYKKLFNPVSP